MMKYIVRYVCVSILVIVLAACAAAKRSDCPTVPKLASINIIDRNGLSETISNRDRLAQFEAVNFLSCQPYQKVMRVFNRDGQGNILAYITSYHPNGQVKQYLEVINNRACGMYREWHQNGRLSLEAVVIGGNGDIGIGAENSWLFDGCSRAWDSDGNLEADIYYCKGVLEGVSVYYHPNGCVWKKTPFVDGKLHGVAEIFLDNGQLLQTTEYCNSLKHGKAMRYWGPDDIAAMEEYQNDKLENGNYYQLDGTLISKIESGEGKRAIFGVCNVAELQEYHDGIQEGRVELFSDKGCLTNMYHYKDGVKNGEEIEYYESRRASSKPMPKISVNWYNGCIQGTVKTWYSNGNLENQREMSKNARNGLSTAWYEDGSLMMVEEYENDKLLKGKYLKKGQKLPISEVREGNGTAHLYDSQGNFLRKVNYAHGKPSL